MSKYLMFQRHSQLYQYQNMLATWSAIWHSDGIGLMLVINNVKYQLSRYQFSGARCCSSKKHRFWHLRCPENKICVFVSRTSFLEVTRRQHRHRPKSSLQTLHREEKLSSFRTTITKKAHRRSCLAMSLCHSLVSEYIDAASTHTCRPNATILR